MNRLCLLVTLLTSALLLSSCALLQTKSTATPRVQLAPNQWIALPTPNQLQLQLTATQILAAQYHIKGKIQTYTSQVQVEANKQHLILVALSPWGSELFSIDYDGHSIQSSSLPMPNASMGIKHTLTDFILTYAPAKLLRQLLNSTAIKLKSSPKQRLLILHNRAIYRISYSKACPWQSQIVFQNLLLNYKLRIKTVLIKDNLGYHCKQ